MIFKEMKEMSDSVTEVANSAKTTLNDISEQTKETLNQTKKTLENGEKKVAEVVEEFKKLSTIAKIGIIAMIGSNVLSIAVSLVTLHKLNRK